MSNDPGIWGWTGDVGRLGFTVTFSLGRTPEDVLTQYGADPQQAEHLTRDGAWIMYPPNIGGAQLRVGMLGRWGFCFEEAGFEGFKTRTLSALSTDTETISFFTSPNKSSFIYLKDCEGIEAFEPGLPETLRGNAPCKFWTDVEKILDWSAQGGTPMLPSHAVLQAITKHIRGPLDRATLEGPLLTSFLPDADRAPMGAEFEQEAEAPAPQAGENLARDPGPPFPPTWDTGPVPVVTQQPVNRQPASYDPVYSRFSREAQAS